MLTSQPLSDSPKIKQARGIQEITLGLHKDTKVIKTYICMSLALSSNISVLRSIAAPVTAKILEGFT